MNYKSELYKIKFNNLDNNYIIIFRNIETNQYCEFHVKNSDAKNIALANERIDSFRLKTYSLVFNFLNAFNIRIDKANIYRENNQIISELILNDGNKKTRIIASFIDSIVLCLQSFSSIHINEHLYNSINKLSDKTNFSSLDIVRNIRFDNMISNNIEIGNLEKTLKKLINEEKYESAAKVRDIIFEHNKNNK